ncbi:MAG: rod shape-determining protein MreC [Clostridia bacterium]|nr:rod shape-determining protein MreC [Clostridia bacterium]
MRFFFRSRKFKIALAAVILLVVFSLIANLAGGLIAPQSSIFGAIAAPFQKLGADVAGGVKDFFAKFQNNEKVILENANQAEEINELNKKIADYDAVKAENEFLKDYLEIKDKNPDFKFSSASVIARDSTDISGGFTIDVGSLNGIKQYDTVITNSGLVGYVSEVGISTSRVTTILDSSISVGAIDSRSRDYGIVKGNLDLAQKGLTGMYNIQRSSLVAIGDYIVTSGSGVFPDGILIGKITNISQEKYTTSLYAEVEPFANIGEIRQVMVITSFDGKSNLSVANGDK